MPGREQQGAGESAFVCPDCRGTGFVSTERDGLRFARPCACRQVDHAARRLAAARIPERYADDRLEDFATLNNPSLERAVASCRRVADEFPSGRFGLLLMGPCGVGKTHLAVSLLRLLIEARGAAGLFTEFYDLLRRIQETYDRRAETGFAEVLQPALVADVLVLDDLGASRMTPWARDTLGQIINERYNHNRLTILTTNRLESPPPGEESLADRIGERLASRLAEMCWTVSMDADDFRRKGRLAGFYR